jgi:hypothetical protein
VFNHIRWKVFLRTNGKTKAELLLRRIAKALGDPMTVLDLKPYRKDPSLFEAAFTTPLGLREVEKAIFETLKRADRIAYRWIVRPPQDYEGGKWDLAGWSENRTKLSGVEAVEFEIANYE